MGVSGRGGMWAALVGLALVTVATAASPAFGADTDWLEMRAMNMAHQGGEDEAPSNTMYAYERSLRLGADMLEVDIHTTADREIVVLHDATVDRTTNGSGRVYDMTLAEVQALDAAHNAVPGVGTAGGHPRRDYPYRGVRTGAKKPPRGFGRTDFRIPTLGEVMRAYPDVPINIEIKGAADTDVASFLRNAEILAAFLNRLGRTDGIIVVSFNDLALVRFHELAPQIDLAPGVQGVAGYRLARVPPLTGAVAFQVPTEFQGVTVVDEQFVDDAHEDGYAVHVWTINDEPTMHQLLDWDVDGVMTAEPIRLERVLCRRGEERPARPDSAPGEHCSRRASIACAVEPVKARRKKKRLRITLRRHDGFRGRCAGEVTVRAKRLRARRTRAFSFGWQAPSAGGPAERTVKVKLGRKLRRAARRGKKVRVRAEPYLAFSELRKLRVR